MQLEQAIFTSSDASRIKGYQIVAQSQGINGEATRELIRWSPSELSDDCDDEWVVSAYPIGRDQTAIARTVSGGPEYSERGGIRVVTFVCLIENKEFAGYGFNPVAVVRAALALGHLRLQLRLPTDLKPIILPDCPFAETNSRVEYKSATARKAGGMLQNQRLAVIGENRPLRFIEQLMAETPVDTRRVLSLTTGLSPSSQRPFRLHLFRESSRSIQNRLNQMNICILNAS